MKIESYPKISQTNSKLGLFIPSLNLPAGITCRENAPCKKDCYALKGNFKFSNVQLSHEKNLEAYKKNPANFFNSISMQLEMMPVTFFRWHSSGDIVDNQYFSLMCKLARKHKGVKFLVFTKKYEIVNSYLDARHKIPKNLAVVFSNWGDWHCENPYNLPTAWVRLKKIDTLIPAKAKICDGFCGKCCTTDNSCWKLKKGESVVFGQH